MTSTNYTCFNTACGNILTFEHIKAVNLHMHMNLTQSPQNTSGYNTINQSL